VAVTLVPTRHWSAARPVFEPQQGVCGASFVLETPLGKLYIVCDFRLPATENIFRRVAEAQRAPPCGSQSSRSAPMSHAGFMRDQHMNPSDAVKALADLRRPRQALANHHGNVSS